MMKKVIFRNDKGEILVEVDYQSQEENENIRGLLEYIHGCSITVDVKGKVTRPEVFQYLEDLRESGVTNMFGAGLYLEKAFGLSTKDAKKVLLEWMESKR